MPRGVFLLAALLFLSTTSAAQGDRTPESVCLLLCRRVDAPSCAVFSRSVPLPQRSEALVAQQAVEVVEESTLYDDDGFLMDAYSEDDEEHVSDDDGFLTDADDDAVGANGRYNESTALYLAHVTSVSYCQEAHVRNWSCGPCALVPPLRDVHVVQDARDNFQGLVGFSALYDAVVVAFRGSMDVSNWIDNLTFFKKRAYAQFPGVMVHEGFYWAYRSVAADVLTRVTALRQQHPHAPVLVTGHSLGGAVAAICAFELKHIEQQPVRQLYTFGKPRVGNANFSTLLRNDSGMEVYRVTHFRDIVPHLPPQFVGFYHTTQEVSEPVRACLRSFTDGC
jgi:hypothetical protein